MFNILFWSMLFCGIVQSVLSFPFCIPYVEASNLRIFAEVFFAIEILSSNL